MNNLDRAKELKIELIRLEKYMSEPYLVNRINEIKQETKQLKEKVEKGCGNQIQIDKDLTGTCGYISNVEFRNIKLHCKDCNETLKLLNEILGEKE